MTRILPPIYALAAIVLLIALRVFVPGTTLFPGPWPLLGLLPVTAGIGLIVAANRQFERHGTPIRPFERPTSLVTHSVYRWSRSPIYLGMVFFVAGLAILSGALTPWLAVVALAVMLDRPYVVREEQVLAETFGDAYRQYTDRVRRWL